MKILSLPTLIAFFIAILLLFEHVFGAEDSDDEDSSEVEEDEDIPSKKKAEENPKPQQLAPLLGKPYQPYLEDPWYFYKWPGYGQAEGVVGRWPWWPAQLDGPQDDENKGDDSQQDDEEEDDEENEYYVPKHKDKHHHHHKKQKPIAVSSVGIGPAVGKPTWWGVLHADVNSRSDLNDEVGDEPWSSEQLLPQPLQRYQGKYYYPRTHYYTQEISDSEVYPSAWERSYHSYGPRPRRRLSEWK